MAAERAAKNDPRISLLAHPGYERRSADAEPEKSGARDFALAMWRHLACLTDGAFHNYTVAKVRRPLSRSPRPAAYERPPRSFRLVPRRTQIFEIPATGCLLLLNYEMDAYVRPLGFEPFVHYVPYSAETFDAVIDAVLDSSNRLEVDAIRLQGQQLVWSRHMSSHRAAAINTIAVGETAARLQRMTTAWVQQRGDEPTFGGPGWWPLYA